ncbi:hypothetical protein J5N97_021852 [Dioscorea zingiberensis]|uniref:Uncharacterized protein n=1 Tax=Dioscorea zingiberensis TaxID=325984 RepID=A0A9D5CA36_9LILI|nr:hypothetical protein J5N97_021852 [Dioscorea zingiberensis]
MLPLQHAHEKLCGRPLGLRFNKTSGELLHRRRPNPRPSREPPSRVALPLLLQLTTDTSTWKLPILFANDLDVHNNGSIFFTDTSMRYNRKKYRKTLVILGRSEEAAVGVPDPRHSPELEDVLLCQPRVVSAQVSHAWDMPENTFGWAYARFMGTRNFSPDDRPPVRFMDSEELAYDAIRAALKCMISVRPIQSSNKFDGESALKVIEFEQMLLPMCLLSVIGGSARFNEKQRALFFRHYFPWATRAGINCTDLICVYYEKHFHENLDDVRKNWGIIPCPDPKLKT